MERFVTFFVSSTIKLHYICGYWNRQLTEMLLCVYRLPSPSATGGRFCHFPTTFRFIPSSADQLVWLSGERKRWCVRFSSPVSNSRKGCVECERCPELYAEFMHRVQQHSLSIWAEAKCGDVQMLPGAATQTQGPTERPENSIASRKEQWHLLAESHHGHFALWSQRLSPWGDGPPNLARPFSLPCSIQEKKSSSSPSFEATNFLP